MTSRPRVVITRRLPSEALHQLAGAADVWVSEHDRPLTEQELHDAVAGADAVLTLLHDRVDDAFLDAAGPGLRCVANVAVGYDNVDVAAAAARDVVVTNTPGVLTDATADLAMSLLLAVTRRIGEGERLIRARTPWSWHMAFMLGSGLQGKTLGVVGLGSIGRAVATRARFWDGDRVFRCPTCRSRPRGATRRRDPYAARDAARSCACRVPPLPTAPRHASPD